ncbi:MAG TPA: hypothetical protein VGI39_17650 [Polyangiaceae bacterium]
MRARSLLLLGVSASALGCFNFGSVSGGTPNDAGSQPSGGDGSVATSGDGGASGTGFCATLAAPTQSATKRFCDDFDDYSGSSADNWDQTIAQNGTVNVDKLAQFSKPASLLTETGAAAPGVQAEADVLRAFSDFTGNGIAISISFEMNIETWDPSSSAQIIAFEVIFKNSTAQFNQLVMNLNSQGTGGVTAQIAENSTGADGGENGYNSYPFSGHPVTKTWTKVEVDINVPNPTGSQSNSITVKLDGKTQISAQALQIPLQGGTPYVHLGIGYVGTAPSTAAAPWTVHYDNFVADITPFTP